MGFSISFFVTPEQMIYAMAAITAILGGKFVLPALRRNNKNTTTKK